MALPAKENPCLVVFIDSIVTGSTRRPAPPVSAAATSARGTGYDFRTRKFILTMRVSERGQITIPKPLRDRFGMNPNVEVEITPTEEGLLIQKRTSARHRWIVSMACSAGAARPTTTSRRSAADDYESLPALTFATLLSGFRSISFVNGSMPARRGSSLTTSSNTVSAA